MSGITPTPGASSQDLTEVLAAPLRLEERAHGSGLSPEPPGPGHYLRVESPRETLLVPLARGVTHVGRGFTADLRIDDKSVSRRHAILVIRGSAGLRVLDDRSSNGTFVNGRRVGQAELQDGDVLVLGRVVLHYRHMQATAAQPDRSPTLASHRPTVGCAGEAW